MTIRSFCFFILVTYTFNSQVPLYESFFYVISQLELFYCRQENLFGCPEIIVASHNKVTVMTLQPFTNEQLNYFKFASVVINDFPKVLRQAFKTRWDNTPLPCGICSLPQSVDQLKSLLVFRMMPGIVRPCSKPQSSQSPFLCETAEDITEHSATCL